ncbi:hypothetical protein ACFODT_00040 [Vibrio zhugei]|uniref:Uncharacterized protein n=1 Tax=Vibrio zhugei TaxID=2479546 RepID=A0ABV7C516_9VIBR|nr:hypothetical protein [Vibrio zhugei]
MQHSQLTIDKCVIDGVYETNKMLLKIGDDIVTKFFKPKSSTPRRYAIEKEALSRLQGIAGIPVLYGVDDQKHVIRMSRLSGESAHTLSPEQIITLTTIVNNMLNAGVARHSMPIRDIVVDENGTLGLVDFERATLRRRSWSPIWRIARKVSLYHLYRLIAEHQPQMLSETQRKLVELGGKVRRIGRMIR